MEQVNNLVENTDNHCSLVRDFTGNTWCGDLYENGKNDGGPETQYPKKITYTNKEVPGAYDNSGNQVVESGTTYVFPEEGGQYTGRCQRMSCDCPS